MKERRTKWDEYPDIMDTADLQEFMDMSKETVLKLVHQPGFPHIRISGGRKYIFPKSALQEYFHRQALSA